MRTLGGLYALVFLGALTDSAIVPLLPEYEREFALSHVQTGALLSVTVLVTLLITVPVGMLVDRIGPKPFVVAAAVAIAVAAVGQAFAPDYRTLLGSRAVFGVSYGIIWTVVPVLVTSAARRSAAAGGAIAVGGAALLAGPPLSGYLADLVWRGAPFVLIAVLAVPLALRLASQGFHAAGATPQHLRETLAVAANEPRVLGAVLLMAVLGLAGGITNLVVPLELSRHGLSAGAIGTAFSAAGAVWIIAAALAGRAWDRRIGLLAVGAGALALGAAWLVPVLSLSTAALAGFLVLSGACRAPLNSVVYLLGQSGAAVRSGAGAVVGLLNVVWACTAFAGPLVAGALAGSGNARWAFVLVCIPALVLGAWMIAAGRPRVAVGVG